MWAYVYVNCICELYVCTQVSACLCRIMYMFMNGYNFRHRPRSIRCASTNPSSTCGPIRKHSYTLLCIA